MSHEGVNNLTLWLALLGLQRLTSVDLGGELAWTQTHDRVAFCQSFCKSTDKDRTRIFCTTMMLCRLDATHAGSQTSLAIPGT